MSADNTIVVLRTAGRNGKTAEYRVAMVFAIENMWYEPNYPSASHPEVNREWLLQEFGNCLVMSAEEALDAASNLKKKVEVVEYGIQFIDYRKMTFPASDEQRERRRHRFSRRWRPDRAAPTP
jgi:hypothetical protein